MENEDEPRRTVTLTQFYSCDKNWYVYNEEGDIVGHIFNMALDTDEPNVVFELSSRLMTC